MKLPTATVLALALIATLAGCASPDAATEARLNRWAVQCGLFAEGTTNRENARLTAWAAESQANIDAGIQCAHDLEHAYQADRALAVERGTAMMGLGTTLMTTTPGYNATPAPAYVEPSIGMGPGPAGSYYNPATPYAPAYVPPGIGMGPGPAGSYYNPSTTPAGR